MSINLKMPEVVLENFSKNRVLEVGDFLMYVIRKNKSVTLG